MGKKYSDSNGFAPTAEIKVAGAMLKGVLQGVREVTTQYGPKPVYTLTVLDADCKFTLGKGEEVEPAEGDKVDVFAPTRLATQLSKVPVGETITIKYLGLGKNSKGANKPHTFSVEGE
jgi:hypothetical protein